MNRNVSMMFKNLDFWHEDSPLDSFEWQSESKTKSKAL